MARANPEPDTDGARRPAFTLLELLVVIAIISLLIGIIIPSLEKARSAARSTACLSNLRSIGQGVRLYLDNASRGVFPYVVATQDGDLTQGDNDVSLLEVLVDYIDAPAPRPEPDAVDTGPRFLADAPWTCPGDRGYSQGEPLWREFGWSYFFPPSLTYAIAETLFLPEPDPRRNAAAHTLVYEQFADAGREPPFLLDLGVVDENEPDWHPGGGGPNTGYNVMYISDGRAERLDPTLALTDAEFGEAFITAVGKALGR